MGLRTTNSFAARSANQPLNYRHGTNEQRKPEEWRARCPLPIVSLDAFVCTLTGKLERDEYVSWSLARGTVALARAAAADLLHCKHFAHLTTSTRKKSPAVRKRRVGGEVCGEPNGVWRVVMGEDQRGA